MMKGLMVKDMALVWMQKRFLVVICLVVLLQIFSGQDILFPLGFMTFIGLLMGISTISYDEFENGTAYLLTLPVSRKEYTGEKYLFCAWTTFLFWLMSFLLMHCVCWARGTMFSTDLYLPAVAVYAGALFMMLVLLPFRFRFEGDSSRVALLVVAALLLCALWAVQQLLVFWGVDLSGWMASWNQMNSIVQILLFLVGLLILMGISFRCSVSILIKKQY